MKWLGDLTSNMFESGYSIIICGAIAAGKSSVVEALCRYFESLGVVFGHVPEYIDGMADGKEMLRKWRDGVIALEDFQKYIIESSVYLNERVFGIPVRIFERSPIEGALVFSRDSEFFSRILQDAVIVHRRFSIPIIKEHRPVCATVNADKPFGDVYKQVKQIVEHDRLSGVTRRIIYLRVSDIDLIIKRVEERGRDSEKSYTREYLKTIMERYDKLFKYKDDNYNNLT